VRRGNRRERIDALCDAALALPEEARAAYLADECANDVTLKAEVESLLAHARTADHFLDAPFGALAANVVGSAGGARTIPSGSTLEHFEVLAALGEGGQGQVYKARDTRLRHEVALKVLADSTSADSAARRALLREARRSAPLSHPGICKVLHVGDSSYGPFMAMELVDGQTLREALSRGPFPIESACRIGAEIARALDHAHAHGIVHRDLKSANVMLTADDHVKVLDFGIAATLPGETVTQLLSSVSSDDAGRIAGTIPYMAPEVLRGRESTIASDIWALGVVLYEMVTGQLPFPGAERSELVACILRDAPQPLPGGIPALVADLIRLCLEKDPARRPPRAGEVALVLEMATRAIAPHAARSDHRPPAPSSSTFRAFRPALVGAAVATIGALTWIALGSRGTPNVVAEHSFRVRNPVQVTSDIGVEEFPAISPDGRTLAYAATGSGSWGNDWDIWVTQPGGSPVNRTGDYAGRDLFPSWSPDGVQIAFWSERDGGGCYVMPAVSGTARRVAAASAVQITAPLWSADGQELSCLVGDQFEAVLVTFDLATGEVRRRLALPGAAGGSSGRMFVTASPGTRRIAYVVSSGGLTSDLTQLLVVDEATGTHAALTDGQTSVWSPVWAPDGSSLLYVSNRGGNADIWQQRFDAAGAAVGEPIAVSSGIGIRNMAVSANGQTLAYAQGRRVANLFRVPILADRAATWADATQITFDQAFVEFADVSRDGLWLAISSDRTGSQDLWVLPASGGDMRQVTADRGAELSPQWSPDSETLAFYSFKTGNRDIYTMPVTGGEWKRVTDNPGEDLLPAWSPDGKEIVFLTSRQNFTAVWVQPVDGREGRAIARVVSSGKFSPDGKQVAFVSDGRLARRNADGTGEIVTVSRGPSRTAVWSRDGRTLYFAGGRENTSTIYTVRADGSGERAITDLRGRRGTFISNSLASDGKHLYFSWQEDLGDIWLADLGR
jgi:Tol biopolymer transport system component/serine/threonine protein kinase